MRKLLAFVFGFLLGAMVGMAIATLLAPAEGEATRGQLQQRVQYVIDEGKREQEVNHIVVAGYLDLGCGSELNRIACFGFIVQPGKCSVAIVDQSCVDHVRDNAVTLLRVECIGEPGIPVVKTDMYRSIPFGIVIFLSPYISQIRPVVTTESRQVGVDAQVPVVIADATVIEIILIFQSGTKRFGVPGEGTETAVGRPVLEFKACIAVVIRTVTSQGIPVVEVTLDH